MWLTNKATNSLRNEQRTKSQIMTLGKELNKETLQDGEIKDTMAMTSITHKHL
jgi:hypothetical protein